MIQIQITLIMLLVSSGASFISGMAVSHRWHSVGDLKLQVKALQSERTRFKASIAAAAKIDDVFAKDEAENETLIIAIDEIVKRLAESRKQNSEAPRETNSVCIPNCNGHVVLPADLMRSIEQLK